MPRNTRTGKRRTRLRRLRTFLTALVVMTGGLVAVDQQANTTPSRPVAAAHVLGTRYAVDPPEQSSPSVSVDRERVRSAVGNAIPTPASTAAPATTSTAPPSTVATTPDPPVPPVPVASPCEQAWQTVLSRVALPAGWTTACGSGRSGIIGLADPATRTISLYPRSSTAQDFLVRVATHELGHAWDFAVLTHADHQTWMAARGGSGSWQSCSAGRCSDMNMWAGDWAEAFAELLTSHGIWHSNKAGYPTPAQFDVVRQILASHGAI